MVVTLPDTIKDIFFCGDLHGNLIYLKQWCKFYNIQDACIFCAGDVGLGFSDDHVIVGVLNKFCKKYNIYIIAVAGNHDNPMIFEKYVYQQYFHSVPNYTVVNVCGKNILTVGGGISIDRQWRKTQPTICYWEDECIKYQPKVKEKIDIIVSHAAPSFAYPFGIGKIVHDFAQDDPTLIEDVLNERQTLDRVWEDYKEDITHWYYGHYHQSQFQYIDHVIFKLLNISEILRHVPDNYTVQDFSN